MYEVIFVISAKGHPIEKLHTLITAQCLFLVFSTVTNCCEYAVLDVTLSLTVNAPIKGTNHDFWWLGKPIDHFRKQRNKYMYISKQIPKFS